MITNTSLNATLPKNERGSYTYSLDEINEAVRVIQTNESGREYERAMGRLIKQCYPYIVKTAAKIDIANIEDKIMAGCEGLLYAARRFNLESGNKFFSFAYNYISGYMMMDFRSTRLIKVTSTMEKELKKPENAVAYGNVTAPLSLDKISNEVAKSDNRKSLENILSDGISYEDVAIEAADASVKNKILKDIVFEAGSGEAFNGLTWAEIFCHLNGLFDYCEMSMQELLSFFDIPEDRQGVIRAHCRKIKKSIRNSRRMKDVLGLTHVYTAVSSPVSRKKPVPAEELPFMNTPEYSIKGVFTQMYFDFGFTPEEETQKIVRKYTRGSGSRRHRIEENPNQMYFDFGPEEAVV